jgi:cation diffusion facilitator family transporter
MSKSCCEIAEKPINARRNESLKKIFWIVLLINLGMFLLEALSAFSSHSNALLADSLDMLGDAFVYGLSLLVLSRSHVTKAKASLVKGVIMTLLGLFVLGQVIYKIIYPMVPVAETITLISLIALGANLLCLFLLTRHKKTDLNTKSAWTCSRNDVVANVGVMIAGLLVGYFNSMWPDLIAGVIIASVVLYSSIDVIRDSIGHKNEATI